MSNLTMRLVFRRLLIVLVVSVIITGLGNEVFFRLQSGEADRAPRKVELVIPVGTAEKIRQGEQEPDIPEEMVFVAGDVLVVRNEDIESHQLGPLWIPANSSASLNLDQPMQYAYRCSFQATNYMGLDVRQPTTFSTRLQGLFLTAPATMIFLFLYSLLVYPLQPEKSEKKAVGFIKDIDPGNE
jgi:hypothetical protein